jgi:SAM-dependent methyltransferase
MDSYADRLQTERAHYNSVGRGAAHGSLQMSDDNIARYRNPPRNTPHRLEFAFHLLELREGDTVLELGCSNGLNTVLLASLGAIVIAIDISEQHLALTRARLRANALDSRVSLLHGDVCALPLPDRVVDKVFGIAILHHVDPLQGAREVRRVLKPGGLAVFSEPRRAPLVLEQIKRLFPKPAEVTEDERPLTPTEIADVSRVIGRAGRHREFGLLSRVTTRFGMYAWTDVAIRSDSCLFRAVPIVRRLASPVVWEVTRGWSPDDDVPPDLLTRKRRYGGGQDSGEDPSMHRTRFTESRSSGS